MGGGRFTARVYEPAEAKSWKAELRIRYERAALEASPTLPVFRTGPVAFLVVCIFPLAKTHERKRPLPRGWKDAKYGGDWDNLGKLYSDAGSGILFSDDGQVCVGIVLRITGAQGEAPKTVVYAMRPEDLPGHVSLLSSSVPAAEIEPTQTSLLPEPEKAFDLFGDA